MGGGVSGVPVRVLDSGRLANYPRFGFWALRLVDILLRALEDFWEDGKHTTYIKGMHTCWNVSCWWRCVCDRFIGLKKAKDKDILSAMKTSVSSCTAVIDMSASRWSSEILWDHWPPLTLIGSYFKDYFRHLSYFMDWQWWNKFYLLNFESWFIEISCLHTDHKSHSRSEAREPRPVRFKMHLHVYILVLFRAWIWWFCFEDVVVTLKKIAVRVNICTYEIVTPCYYVYMSIIINKN